MTRAARTPASSRPVPRPRPLRTLIDGRPDEPGRVVARRAMLLLTAAVLAANVVGAIVVFVLVVWVLPLPEIEDRDTLLLINLAAEGAYVLAAGVIGTVWGVGRWRSTRRWLEEDREPTDAERRTTLRVPLRLLHISGVLWLLGGGGVLRAQRLVVAAAGGDRRRHRAVRRRHDRP